ncbi:hypothetical protein J6590_000296 [Homalodisca vitripennis]|nr:hypothetical protein J6590_000296 [Homalodisca vitripennis]
MDVDCRSGNQFDGLTLEEELPIWDSKPQTHFEMRSADAERRGVRAKRVKYPLQHSIEQETVLSTLKRVLRFDDRWKNSMTEKL